MNQKGEKKQNKTKHKHNNEVDNWLHQNTFDNQCMGQYHQIHLPWLNSSPWNIHILINQDQDSKNTSSKRSRNP